MCIHVAISYWSAGNQIHLVHNRTRQLAAPRERGEESTATETWLTFSVFGSTNGVSFFSEKPHHCCGNTYTCSYACNYTRSTLYESEENPFVSFAVSARPLMMPLFPLDII